jgi:hypothetical protein
VEQLLGLALTPESLRVVRWMSMSVVGDLVELRLHEAEDVGTDDFADVSAFPSIDADDDEFGEGKVVASGDDVSALLSIAVSNGASPDRWVNQGLIDDEYLDAR